MHGQQNIKICIDFDYLSLAVSNHHSKRMRSITLSRVPCLALTDFANYYINETIFIEEIMEHKMRFLIFLQILQKRFFPTTNSEHFLKEVYINYKLLFSD